MSPCAPCSPRNVRRRSSGLRSKQWSTAAPPTRRELWETCVGLEPSTHGSGGVRWHRVGVPQPVVVAEELGRVAAPSPLLATIAELVPVLVEADGGEPWLEQVASGALSGTAAYDTDRVLCGSEVDVIAVVRDDHVALVPTADAKLHPIRALDATRTLDRLDASRSTEVTGCLSRQTLRNVRSSRSRPRSRSSSWVRARRSSPPTWTTPKERQQFGVPIGSFQAVKHKLVNMFVAIERARGACIFATATIAEDDDRRTLAVAAAKAAAGDCQRLVVQDGIQLLGGIGYTWEHDQQLFVKRAKTSDALLGNAAWHRQQIAEALGL